jgi:hypothetical protein
VTLRFAVGAHDGPRTAVWRAWRHGNAAKSDVFLAARSLAGVLKISFHESGEIRDAFTSQYQGQLVSSGAAGGGRLRIAWQRSSFLDTGAVRMYQVVFPHTELREWPLEVGLTPDDVRWIPASTDFDTTCVEFVVTKLGLDEIELKGLRPATDGPIAHWFLPSGENFLVLPRYADLEPGLTTSIRAAAGRIALEAGAKIHQEPAIRMNLVMNPAQGVGTTIETAWPCTV